jgi:hypothetical protein
MSECVLCRETVTNPICMDCVNEGIEQWLKEKNLPALDLDSFGVEGESCIRCKKSIDVCLYCHTKQVLDLLKIRKTDVSIIKEFVEFFHFDLDKKGYLAEEGYI